MSEILRCDNCGVEADRHITVDPFSGWMTLQNNPQTSPLHFCSYSCLTAWLVRVNERITSRERERREEGRWTPR